MRWCISHYNFSVTRGSWFHYLYKYRCTTVPPSDRRPSRRRGTQSPSLVLFAAQSLKCSGVEPLVKQSHSSTDDWSNKYSPLSSGCWLANGATLSLLVLWPAGGLCSLGSSEVMDWVTTTGLERFLISHWDRDKGGVCVSYSTKCCIEVKRPGSVYGLCTGIIT